MQRLRIILCLGSLAHGAVLTTLGARKVLYPFRHGALHRIDGLAVADSYHCSRYNTNTGRLTEAMFEEVFAAIRERLLALAQSPGPATIPVARLDVLALVRLSLAAGQHDLHLGAIANAPCRESVCESV